MNILAAISWNMLVAIGGRVLAAVIGLFSIAMLTRYLGPEDFGYYRTILTVTGVSAILADLGMDLVILRMLGREKVPHALLSSALVLRLLVTSVVMAAIALAAPLLPYGEPVTTGILVAAPFYVAFQAALMLQGVFQKHLRQDLQMVAESIGNVVMLGLTWSGILLGQGVWFMVAAMVAGGMVQLSLLIMFAGRFETIIGPVRFELWWRIMREGLPVAGSQFALMMILRGDILILSLLAPAAAVGLYGVPSKMFEVVGAVGAIYAGIMMPRMMEAREKDHFQPLLQAALDGVIIAAFGVVLTLGLFAKEIVVLIAGQDFVAAAPALLLVSIGIGANMTGRLLRNLLLSFDLAKTLLRTDLCLLFAAIVFYLTFIPWLSFTGAALATALTECLLMLALMWLARKQIGLCYPLLRLFRIALAAALASAFKLSFPQFFWPVLFLGTSLLYLAFLIAFKVITMQYLRAIFRH